MDYNLKTYSRFIYGIEVVAGANVIDFFDGVSNKSATIPIGGYSLGGLAREVARQMNRTTENLGFEVLSDRDFIRFTIKTLDNSNFSLLFDTGFNNALSAYALLGFTQSDFTGSSQYTSSVAVAKTYLPQFYLQNYIDAELNSLPIEAVVNRSTSGNKFEVVKFGSNRLYKFEIQYTTNLELENGSIIRQNLNGVDDLKDFMEFCIKKYPLEFFKDESDSGNYDTVVLETTPQSADGVAYEISPDYNADLPEFYTLGGQLAFRRI
jgi:hypothetical protein